MKEGRYTEIIHHGNVKKIPIIEPVRVTRFEYDYLMAQTDVDTQILHMSRMIDMGYFKALSPYFVKDTRRDCSKMQYVLIGVIRDLLCADAFVIEEHSCNSEVTSIE